VGGWLFATRKPGQQSHFVTVCAATWAGEGARASRNRITLGDAYGAQAELPDNLEHLKRIGDFHTHTAGSLRPSRPDMRAWAGTADSLGLNAYVGLIVSPSTGERVG
jgi:proteasome lid subunit RPN8/RPN11